MTTEPKKKSKTRIIIFIIVGGVVLFCIVCSLLYGIISSTPESKASSTARAIERATEAAIPTAIPWPTNTPEPAPPFEEIRSNVESMTEAQWKAYLPTLKGLAVENWTGWVSEVNVDGKKYELWVDMDPPDSLFSTQDVYFYIPNEIALELQKNERITFSGRIKNVSEFLGSVSVRLEDATFQREK